jgi:anti-sigma regulatory factor (Ser/Thr protein kinase)
VSTTAPPLETTSTGLVHEAFPYRDDREFLHVVLAYVRSALAAGHAVLVELPGARDDLVRAALGDDAARVTFGDMADEGRNPSRIIPGVLAAFIDTHADRRVSVVAEAIWPGRSVHEYAAGVEHEALVNLVFAGQPVSILCPYNAAELPAQAVDDAERTHPAVRDIDGQRVSSNYTDPRTVVAMLAEQRPPPPPDASVFEFDVVAHARTFATQCATRAGLPDERLTDLVIAISELGGNSIAHSGSGGTLLCWQEDGSLVCELRDEGQISDPLAGRVRPPDAQESGRGLLMVNYLCDLVQVKTGPSGTATRIWMTLPKHEA